MTITHQTPLTTEDTAGMHEATKEPASLHEQIAPADETINSLATRIETKHGRYDVYTTANRRWAVRVTAGTRNETFVDNGLAAAMLAAYLWTPLPQVPRKPRAYHIDGFSPWKSGSKWRMNYMETDMCIAVATKKAAMQFAHRVVEQSDRQRDEWHREYGWALEKRDGVDFEYVDP